MLSTLALIELSQLIQLYTYACTSIFERPTLALSKSVYVAGLYYLLFFFGQLVDMARLALILTALKTETLFAKRAFRIKMVFAFIF